MRRLALALVVVLPGIALALPDVTARGPFTVGRRTVTFTKPSETTGAPRRLDTLIWYPAVPGTGIAAGDIRVEGDVVRRRSPLIMFSHGSCGIPGQSPFYTEALASWGFVVAAPPHPGNTTFEFATCSQPQALADSFANRVADIEYVLDQLLAAKRGSPFFRRINRRRLGMSGHSFGGQTTLRVAAMDQRIRGSAALAPATLGLIDPIATPMIVLGGELDTLTPFDAEVRAAFALLTGPRFLVEIANTGHCAFVGICIASVCGAGCEPEATPLAEANRLTLRYAVPFLLRYVAGKRRFGPLLAPDDAPGGVQVLEARPRG